MTNPTLPAGLTLCIMHAEGNPFDGLDLSKPFPTAVPSSDVVGCDRSFSPGLTYEIDFDPSNTPGFDEFAARLTDGVDDLVWDMASFVDASLNAVLIAGGGAINERSLADRTQNGGTSTGGLKGADFAGFTLDFARLRISDIQFRLEGDYLNYSWRRSWEFWGRIAQAQ